MPGAWELERQVKLGYIIPLKDKVDMSWVLHFIQLVTHTRLPQAFYVSKHYRIDEARNRATLKALKEGCTHLMFLDSDVIPMYYDVNTKKWQFNPLVIRYMISLDYPIISGLYYTSRLVPNVYVWDGKEKTYKPFDIERLIGEQGYADACGLGFVLIQRKVFEVMKEKGYFPWFEYKCDYEVGSEIKIKEVSEDIDFCLKARKCGFKVLVLGNIFCKHIVDSCVWKGKEFEPVWKE